MSIYTIARRLDRLDTGRSIDTRRVVVMELESDEPIAAAIARWCASHPGEPPLADDDNTLIIMQTIVDPPKGPSMTTSKASAGRTVEDRSDGP